MVVLDCFEGWIRFFVRVFLIRKVGLILDWGDGVRAGNRFFISFLLLREIGLVLVEITGLGPGEGFKGVLDALGAGILDLEGQLEADKAGEAVGGLADGAQGGQAGGVVKLFLPGMDLGLKITLDLDAEEVDIRGQVGQLEALEGAAFGVFEAGGVETVLEGVVVAERGARPAVILGGCSL